MLIAVTLLTQYLRTFLHSCGYFRPFPVATQFKALYILLTLQGATLI